MFPDAGSADQPDPTRPLGDGVWLGLAPGGATGDAWQLTVVPKLCGRTGNLHGGCSLAAAATAMEQATGRPLSWATAQFVGRAAVGEVVTYTVRVASAGNRTSQVGAVATVGDRTIGNFLGAFGERPGATTHRWGRPPQADPPEACPPYALGVEPEGSFHRTVELRVAALDADAGTVAFWGRMPDGMHGTAAGLTMLGDYVPAAFRLVLQETEKPASSLDNTIRVVGVEAADWLLLDVRLGAITGGAAHGDLRAWSPSGRLLAVASQTFAFNV